MRFVSKSAKETHKIGELLGKQLSGGETICLFGDLGAGKTFFTQGLAKGLGIKRQITSPTFTLMKQYEIRSQKQGVKGKNLVHLDCYRIKTPEEIFDLGIEEIWNDPKNITVIEWAEKIKNFLPPKRLEVYMKHLGEEKRKILVKSK